MAYDTLLFPFSGSEGSLVVLITNFLIIFIYGNGIYDQIAFFLCVLSNYKHF